MLKKGIANLITKSRKKPVPWFALRMLNLKNHSESGQLRLNLGIVILNA